MGIGICRGQAIAKALGDKSGITRYGTFFCPMDEALSRIVLDLSGRPYLVFDVDIAVERIGTFETEMVREFFLALASNSGMTLPLRRERPPHRRIPLQRLRPCPW